MCWATTTRRSVVGRRDRWTVAQGVDGWVDETLAIVTGWDELNLTAIETSIVWRHAPTDRNVPASAARRVAAALPRAQWREWPDGGHLVAYYKEGEVLDELLERAA
jgi:pimeloyl-ACP methyl ester carboxylesterase